MGDISTACRLSEEPHMDVIRASKTHGDNLRRRTLSGFALRHNNGQTDSYWRTHWHARPQVRYHQREHSVRANIGKQAPMDSQSLPSSSVDIRLRQSGRQRLSDARVCISFVLRILHRALAPTAPPRRRLEGCRNHFMEHLADGRTELQRSQLRPRRRHHGMA